MCWPKEYVKNSWKDYMEVQVSFIRINEKRFKSPSDWNLSGEKPTEIFGFVPVRKVKEFIQLHGGEKNKTKENYSEF